jgi:hypothetical protein
MNEDELKDLALEMDVALTHLCAVCNNQPLVLSGVLLARLTHFNDFLGCGQDFRDLCKFISQRPIHDPSALDSKMDNVDEANKLLKKFMKPNKGE